MQAGDSPGPGPFQYGGTVRSPYVGGGAGSTVGGGQQMKMEPPDGGGGGGGMMMGGSGAMSSGMSGMNGTGSGHDGAASGGGGGGGNHMQPGIPVLLQVRRRSLTLQLVVYYLECPHDFDPQLRLLLVRIRHRQNRNL